MKFVGLCPACGMGTIEQVKASSQMGRSIKYDFRCSFGCSWQVENGFIISMTSGGAWLPNSSNLGKQYIITHTPGSDSLCRLADQEEVEKAPPPEIQKDIVAEPILAWRIWNINVPMAVTLDQSKIDKMQREMREGYDPFSGLLSPCLQGVGVKQDWDAPTQHATCEMGSNGMGVPGHLVHREDVHVPAEKCSCGMWALKDEETMLTQLGAYSRGQPMAYGQVQLWGRIFQHEKGYRGEYARPVSIKVFGVTDEVAAELEAKYGCTVEKIEAPQVTSTEELYKTALLAHANFSTQLNNLFTGSVSVTQGFANYTGTLYGHYDLGTGEQVEDIPLPKRLWNYTKHPWTQGPLRRLRTTDVRGRDWAFSEQTFFAWTCRFHDPIGFLLFLGAPVTLPLYYLKRAVFSASMLAKPKAGNSKIV